MTSSPAKQVGTVKPQVKEAPQGEEGEGVELSKLILQPDPTKDYYSSKGRLSPAPPEEKRLTAGPESAPKAPPTPSERVKVVVRCRPLSEKEVRDGHENVVHVHLDRGEIEVRPQTSGKEGKVFGFDAVYDNRKTQMEVYEESFAPIVDSVLEGFNGTIFAYGQTGTGKTYTMEGIREKEGEAGVIPNSFRHIFSHVASHSNKEYLIRASYLEIYQEEIRDLLSKDRSARELRESPTAGVYVKGLSTHLCSSLSSLLDLISRGNRNRAVGATNMNEHSSRSHAIFIITVEMSEQGLDGRAHFRVGKLNLVDLAGSERQGKTGASGERFKEATKINLSLSALGNVISALVEAKPGSHIPYRDSKLTRLLQDSLGGNARTVMVATVGPASYNLEETITTLRYASRAKRIKNRPKVNEDPKDALLRQYQEEISRLREELQGKKKTRMSSSTSSTRPSSSASGLLAMEGLEELTRLLETYGLDPTTPPDVIKATLAEKRKELMEDTEKMKTEKDLLLSRLDQTEALVRSTEQEVSALSERIAWLESKVVHGGKDLLDRTNEQEKLLQEKQQELAEQAERYEEMKRRLAEEELTLEELRVTADGLDSEFQSRFRKVKKLSQRGQQMKEAVQTAHDTHAQNVRELELCLMELRKELSLKTLIIDNFIPPSSRDLMERRLHWMEDKGEYVLQRMEGGNGLLRPTPNRSLPFPLFTLPEGAKGVPLKGVHARNENILQIQPDLPSRRSKVYIPPSQDPYLASLIKRAMEEVDRELVVQCGNKRRTRSARVPLPEPAIIQSRDYFRVGDNLVRRVRSGKSLLDHSGLAFKDFAIVNQIIPSSTQGRNTATTTTTARSTASQQTIFCSS